MSETKFYFHPRPNTCLYINTTKEYWDLVAWGWAILSPGVRFSAFLEALVIV